MDSQSILYRTLWLFAGAFAAAVVLILTVAAIVTPPDVLSQVILFSAIYPLYEISIFLIARFERQRAAEEGADEDGEAA